MSFQATTVNGVTKQQNGNEYFYFFPLCTFQVFDAAVTADQYFFQLIRGEVRKVEFDDVTDKLGTTNIIDYFDAAANASLFFSLNTGGGGGDATAANQATQITEAQTANTYLASLDGKDFATETTLDALLTAVQNQDNTLTSDSATLRVMAELLFEIRFLLKSIAE